MSNMKSNGDYAENLSILCVLILRYTTAVNYTIFKIEKKNFYKY